MKKKTLFILLVIAVSILYFIVFIRTMGLVANILTYINSFHYSFLKMIEHYLIVIVEIILQLFSGIFFTYIAVKIGKMENLTLSAEETALVSEKKKQARKETKIQKVNRKIEKLNFKIKTIQEEDDR